MNRRLSNLCKIMLEPLKVLAANIKHLRRLRSLLPKAGSSRAVLIVPAENDHPYYESIRDGLTANGWTVRWLLRYTGGAEVSHQLLLYALAVPAFQAIHLIDIDLNTLFGQHNRIRKAASFAAIRFLVAWPHLLRRRVVYSFGDPVPHETRTTAEERRHRLICSLADDVLSVAPTLTASLLRAGIPEDRIWPFEHPDIARYFGFPREWRSARDAYDLPDDAIVLLLIGNIRPYKGLETAVRGLKLASEPRLRLVIAGKPCVNYTVESVSSMAADDSRIVVGPLRKLSNEEMGWLFAAADYCILPYVNIGHSGIICQSLGLGVPVIASDTGSMRDYVAAGTGLLFSPSDSVDLARKLDNLVLFDHDTAKANGLAIMRRRCPTVMGERLGRIYRYRRGGPQPDREYLF